MSTETQGFWSGRKGLGRHFWLYFLLPVFLIAAVPDVLHLMSLYSLRTIQVLSAIFCTGASVVAFVTAVPLFQSIIRSSKGIIWKILVTAATLLILWAFMRLAYVQVLMMLFYPEKD